MFKSAKKISMLFVLVFLPCLFLNGDEAPTMQFEAHLSVNDPKTLQLLREFEFKNRSIVDLTAGNFTFSEDDFGRVKIGGVEISIDDFRALIEQGHAKGCIVKMTFGGKFKPLSPYLQDTYDVKYLSAQIAKVVYQYDLDGVDLYLPESILNPELVVLFLQELRELAGTAKIITLSLPGHAWTPYYSQIVKSSEKYVNFITLMEYDLWIDEGSNYMRQIETDVVKCMQNWNIDSKHLQLGLLVGSDSMTPANTLNEEESKTLTNFAKSLNLSGVVVQDLNQEKGEIFAKAIMAVLFDTDSPTPPPVVDEPTPVVPPPSPVPEPIDEVTDDDEDFFKDDDDTREDGPPKEPDLEDFE